MRPRRILVQVPEICFYNPYVMLQAGALAEIGYKELLPHVCRDEPGWHGAAWALSRDALPRSGQLVLHIHWPDKLLAAMSADQAVHALLVFRERGFLLVRTHHNLHSHEAQQRELERRLLEVCDGHHVFSRRQQDILRAIHGDLLGPTLVMPHPLFPLTPRDKRKRVALGSRSRDTITIGCFGRLRHYKRTVAFARKFRRMKPRRLRLVIVGLPETSDIDESLRRLSTMDSRIEYYPGFVSHDVLTAWLERVDYAVLPYSRIWSSGLLVLALQLNTPLVCARPDMLDSPWPRKNANDVVLERWNDGFAIEWLDSHGVKRPARSRPAKTNLPSWREAAVMLNDFYVQLRGGRHQPFFKPKPNG